MCVRVFCLAWQQVDHSNETPQLDFQCSVDYERESIVMYHCPAFAHGGFLSQCRARKRLKTSGRWCILVMLKDGFQERNHKKSIPTKINSWLIEAKEQPHLNNEKQTGLIFHCTGCLIGILIMGCEIVPIWLGRISSPTYTLNNQGPFFSLLISRITQNKHPKKSLPWTSLLQGIEQDGTYTSPALS